TSQKAHVLAQRGADKSAAWAVARRLRQYQQNTPYVEPVPPVPDAASSEHLAEHIQRFDCRGAERQEAVRRVAWVLASDADPRLREEELARQLTLHLQRHGAIAADVFDCQAAANAQRQHWARAVELAERALHATSRQEVESLALRRSRLK